MSCLSELWFVAASLWPFLKRIQESLRKWTHLSPLSFVTSTCNLLHQIKGIFFFLSCLTVKRTNLAQPEFVDCGLLMWPIWDWNIALGLRTLFPRHSLLLGNSTSPLHCHMRHSCSAVVGWGGCGYLLRMTCWNWIEVKIRSAGCTGGGCSTIFDLLVYLNCVTSCH